MKKSKVESETILIKGGRAFVEAVVRGICQHVSDNAKLERVNEVLSAQLNNYTRLLNSINCEAYDFDCCERCDLYLDINDETSFRCCECEAHYCGEFYCEVSRVQCTACRDEDLIVCSRCVEELSACFAYCVRCREPYHAESCEARHHRTCEGQMK